MQVILDFIAAKWPDFAINLIASGVVVVAVLWIERSKRPKIEFEIEPEPPITLQGDLRRKFLRLRVHNRQINPLIGYFYTRSPAIACRATITYLREDNELVFNAGHRQIGRWSVTPEPVALAFTGTDFVQIQDLSRTRDAIDIPPGQFETLDIVMRTSTEDICIGWQNLIISNPHPKPSDEFTLKNGRYHVVVTVRTDGRDYRRTFRIVNDQSFEHFRLEILKSQPNLDVNI